MWLIDLYSSFYIFTCLSISVCLLIVLKNLWIVSVETISKTCGTIFVSLTVDPLQFAPENFFAVAPNSQWYFGKHRPSGKTIFCTIPFQIVSRITGCWIHIHVVSIESIVQTFTMTLSIIKHGKCLREDTSLQICPLLCQPGSRTFHCWNSHLCWSPRGALPLFHHDTSSLQPPWWSQVCICIKK